MQFGVAFVFSCGLVGVVYRRGSGATQWQGTTGCNESVLFVKVCGPMD